jgi:predicted glycoside hydrolase/deacetylase ChbG (UPF0249 family)
MNATSAVRGLIVNADDFGMSCGVNEGVIRAHEYGVVTAASLMTRGAQAAAAGNYARRTGRLSVGLHFDFGEWRCVDGNWIPQNLVVDPNNPLAVEREAQLQLEAFRDLVGQSPTHLDSHQHFHRRQPYRSVLESIANDLQIPLREAGPIRYVGNFYGQDDNGARVTHHIRPEFFLQMAAGIEAGVTEFSCHPAAAVDTGTVYNEERMIELATLCDPDLRAGLRQLSIFLTTFSSS